MTPGRKTRGDATHLAAYDDDLDAWLCQENLTYAQAATRLHERHGVDATVKQLHRWYQRHTEGQLRERVLRNITTGAEAVRQIRTQAQAHGIPQLDELIGWVRVLIANLATRPDAEVNVVALTRLIQPAIDWARLQTRHQELDLDRERLELLKRKAEMADAAKAVTEAADLTPEERMDRIKAVFGMS